MAEVYDLENERAKRINAMLISDTSNFRGFAIDLDTSKTQVMFTGHHTGNINTPDTDIVRIIAYDTSGPSVKAFGALRMTRKQWEEFVKMGNLLLSKNAK